MKNIKLITILYLLLLTSCNRNIFVWTIKDIVGVSFFVIAVVVVAVILTVSWIQDIIYYLQRKNKNKK